MTSTVPTVPDTIAAFVHHHVDAMNRADAAAVAACYAEDASSFDLAPPLAYSSPRDDRQAQVSEWLSGFAGPVHVEVRDLVVTASGDVAFAHSLNALTATPVGSPAPFTLWYRTTLGLRRIEVQWQIVHEHKSTPFHMEMDENYSFRAATDLQP